MTLNPFTHEEGHGQPPLYVHPLGDGTAAGLYWWLYCIGDEPVPVLSIVGWVSGTYVSHTRTKPGAAKADIPRICEGVAADARRVAEAKALRNQASAVRKNSLPTMRAETGGATNSHRPPDHTELGASSG